MLSKTGSAMSTKQLLATVRDGRMVTFFLAGVSGENPGPVTISGYLAGIDDYHWLVFEPKEERLFLVHKGNVAAVEIDRESTYASGQTADSEKVIAPFRGYVERWFRGKGGSDDD